MVHVAIMRKAWGLLEKILTGDKTIESRWYKTKQKPWGTIFAGDIVYFKNSGEPVTVKTEVEKVIQFADLTPEKVRGILAEYGKDDGIEEAKAPEFFERFKDKKYCLLMYLKNPTRVTPFDIDKAGFGAMAAWLTVRDIDEVKK